MTKKAQMKKNKLLDRPLNKMITLDQQMQIQLLEQSVQASIVELNTLPRLILTAFIAPFILTYLFKPYLPDWDATLSKLFIKLHLRSDDMDPVLLNMANDYLDASTILTGFDEGSISTQQLIQKIQEQCYQFSQSELLKNLNFTYERFLRFTAECRLNFAAMPVAELRGNFKKISDKLMVVRSLSIEDLLAVADKKQSFVSIASVLVYKLVAKNTIDPLFHRMIPRPLFFPNPFLLRERDKKYLSDQGANNYLSELTKNKKKLAQYQAYQKHFFRFLLASLVLVYLLFGIGQGQLSLLFLGVINVAFSGLITEIKSIYQDYIVSKGHEKKYQQIKALLNSYACHIESKPTADNRSNYFVIRFAPQQVITEGDYPLSSYRVISLMTGVLREHKIKVIYDKKNTLAISGNFVLSDAKITLLGEQLAQKMKQFSLLHDGAKKIKSVFHAARLFGVEDITFIRDSLSEKAAVNVSVSFSRADAIDKVKRLAVLLNNKEITLFYNGDQMSGAEFILDNRVEQVSYLAALAETNQWKKDALKIKKITDEVCISEENVNSVPKKINRKKVNPIQEKENNYSIPQWIHEKPIPADKICYWKSATYVASDPDCKVYPLRGRGLPAGRYFITAQLNKNRKINPAVEEKIVHVMEQGKVGKNSSVILRGREKSASRYFGNIDYLAKVKPHGVGGVNEPRGYCTALERSENNEILYILTDIYSKVH